MLLRVVTAVLLTALISLFAVDAPHAQFNGCRAGFCTKVPVSAGTGYSGPCDSISGATAFSGFISCSAAYASAHSPAADICDQATCLITNTINFLSTGYWDAATAAASTSCFASIAVPCVVTKFYDSTGNGNSAPSFVGNGNGLIVFNALGSCTGITQSTSGADFGDSPLYVTGTLTTVNQPWSLVTIAERLGSFTTQQYPIGSSSGGGISVGFSTAANEAQLNAPSAQTLSGVTDSSPHAIIGIGNGAASSLNVDGSSTGPVNAGTGTISDIYYGGDAFGNGLHAPSFFVASGLWPSAINVSTMNTKLHSLCGGF